MTDGGREGLGNSFPDLRRSSRRESVRGENPFGMKVQSQRSRNSRPRHTTSRDVSGVLVGVEVPPATTVPNELFTSSSVRERE